MGSTSIVSASCQYHCRLPFFAFVREADGKMMSSGEVSVITGRSAAELQQKINQVKQAMPDVQIITKAETQPFITELWVISITSRR